ncbi:MAG: helix-turn-helix domain-containing protein [Candidatus Jettenia sp.]|uniref:helix-turn-helix domain-containing protein n=1 Tax=Candidatus Jettenia sp. AMX1 TaxID=2293637 RepID=UPI00058F8C94|nr:MAG: DNA-binding protein [Candidatus Jettenia sp. AMX1]MBC6930042.1 helix-turn-helix domain-containing protein [Candidatus Jettenia sp.]GIL20817.1 MAG: hypothetical protein BroJett041_19310 [Candidatus Jettenia caeni]MCE7881698.1 helix-turn-helix domain-containing protein [Candidatus Jettenia sp. AMX1]MCQ3928320.1 helix-turn-helix domain-containing protein [Candidatus Jettenia sp.]
MQIVKNEDSEFLNFTQAAALLGVSVDTIYSWTMRRTVPFYKLGKLVRFKKSDLIKHMESLKIATRGGV